MGELLNQYAAPLTGLAILSALLFAGSLLALPWLVTAIPTDYFAGPKPPPRRESRHPVLRRLVRVGRNVLGVVLVLAGLGMLVLPGQGILTILAGLLLLEFPGKRRLELGLVRRKQVLLALNWLRKRRGAPELRVWKPGARTESEPSPRDRT